MKIHNRHSIIELAIAHTNQWSVYVANHLSDFNVAEWEYYVNLIKERYPEQAERILFDSSDAAIFGFETEQEAVNFYKIFEYNILYASGLYAVLFDPNGNAQTENT